MKVKYLLKQEMIHVYLSITIVLWTMGIRLFLTNRETFCE
jgi:hypothetical protein